MSFKFLLVAVNAKYIHSNPAVYSLRACAGEELRPCVEVAEYTINQPVREILGDIYGRKADAVGFSCYIWNWRLIRELLGELPKLLPDTDLWLGGPEVTYDASVILREFPSLTGIMVGEGEVTFRELLKYYKERAEEEKPGGEAAEEAGKGQTEEERCRTEAGKGEGRRVKRSLQSIAGLCLPEGYTPCRGLADMNALPFPYEDLKPFGNRILYYESSRGCPFRCSYCLSSIDKRVRFRDIDKVKRELQFFLDRRVKQVKFVDRTFNCSREHAMEVWQYIYEHDNGVTNFHFEISADILGQEEVALLNRMRPGQVQLEIGVQSVNPDTLRAVGRVSDMGRLKRTVEALRAGKNIHLHLDLIAGLPFEDYGSFGRSFDQVYGMRPDQLQLGFLKVLKGSGMWERAEKYGIAYTEQPPYEVLYTAWLSYEEVLRLKRIEEMVELYYNSGQFVRTLLFLKKAFRGPFAMYEALADFYREKGYFTASPARSYRYHILLKFATEHDPGRAAAYGELLTYDLYLREKVKSRPDFAGELSAYGEEIQSFYREEERSRHFLPEYEGYDWKQMSKMTHLEPFYYPVWDEGLMEEFWSREQDETEAAGDGGISGDAFAKMKEDCGEIPAKEPAFVLFDYRGRNPLNGDAAVRCVPTATGEGRGRRPV